MQALTDQMQISPDYIAAALIVHIGSLIGRKRGLELRPGTQWVEFPNLWGMLIGRPSSLKSVAMQSVIKPLVALADQAKFDSDRIGRESTHIEAVCISILGGIQPGPIAQYVNSAIKGGMGDDGFIQRF